MTPPPPAPALEVPQRIGKYPITGVLGKGAMGVVYKAFDPVIQRQIAIKTIRKDLAGDDERAAATFAARFKTEAQAAGRLQHAGLVAVYEYGEDSAQAYIAMEFVEGISLRHYIGRGVVFAEHDLVSIMAQLLDALAYAHGRGVVHRDIKPANLIIMNSGRLKIADFGVARIDASAMTQAGAVMGTPGYIAPEIYLGKSLDHRVDVFACGVVLYHLLTGRLPFTGPAEAIMYQVCHEQPALPSAITERLGCARFDAVVLAALARAPEDRWGSALAFRKALLQAYDRPVNPTVAEETILRDGPAATPEAGGVGRGSSSPAPPSAGASGAGSGSLQTQALVDAGWDAEVLHALEHRLARLVGPVARVIVRREARGVNTLEALIEKLATQLASPEERTAFSRALTTPEPAEAPKKRRFALGGSGGGGAGKSATGGLGAAAMRNTSGAADAHAGDNTTAKKSGARTIGQAVAASHVAHGRDEQEPDVKPGSAAAGHGGEATQPSSNTTGRRSDLLTPEVIDRATVELTPLLGPIARVIVRRSVRPDLSRGQFLAEVAQHIVDPAQRQAFVTRVLTGR